MAATSLVSGTVQQGVGRWNFGINQVVNEAEVYEFGRPAECANHPAAGEVPLIARECPPVRNAGMAEGEGFADCGGIAGGIVEIEAAGFVLVPHLPIGWKE